MSIMNTEGDKQMHSNCGLCFEIIKKIENAGFEAYAVGGFVRDFILGNVSYDIDITTSATPSEIKNVFSEYNVIETGIKHGTVTVIYNNTAVEITTFRTESEYRDNRHPDEVMFSRSLSDDLRRRDFTINALCMNSEGQIIDEFSGRDDIDNKIIRAIGNAEERFNEDSLRILRALRFASVLGFDIEKSTSDAIHNSKNLILNVANERIATELRKMITGKNIRKILLEYSDVFSVIIPELIPCIGFEQHNFHHKYDVYTHIATVVENSPQKDYIRLAALFHDIGKPICFSLDDNGVGHFYAHASLSSEIAFKVLKRLRFDNNTINTVTTLVKQHDSCIDEDEKIIKRKLNRFGEKMLRDLILLQKADTLGLADIYHSRLTHFESINRIIQKIVDENNCFSVKNLDVNGKDLLKLGYKGKEVGEALDFLVMSVIDEKVQNVKEYLLNYLKENY